MRIFEFVPEGPEVEVIRQGLLEIVGKSIDKVTVSKNKKYWPNRVKFKALEKSKITKLERKAKFLIWTFQSQSGESYGLSHLGMTGVWHYYSDKQWESFDQPLGIFKHYKLYFRLNDNTHLLFVDVRTFGRFETLSLKELEEHKAISNLGPDILDSNFDFQNFLTRARGKFNSRKMEIGKLLLNPKVVSGCGNIYKSEALFLAKINPLSPVDLIPDNKMIELGKCLLTVGLKALKRGGSSIRDYEHLDGYRGLMQNEFMVYDLADEPCSVCSTIISSGKQGDRTSFWCGHCQDLYL